MLDWLKAIAKEGTLNVIALIVICALIWFGGEYKQVDVQLRIKIICVVLVIWLVLHLIQRGMAIRSAMRIERQLREQAALQVQAAAPDKRGEVQALQSQFHEALAMLKSSKMGQGALYKLPWYVVIGPSGAGKSTALSESGLNFPSMGQGPRGVRGIGGTRNCDWWFTDEAVFLDTAGRYTTQPEDQREWYTFLDLVRRSRKKKPLNGVLLVVSLSDVMKMNEEAIEAYAKPMRDRLDELSRRLEQVFPIYLLITKCDLVQGFSEFFDGLDRKARSQIWGCTLPYLENRGADDELFEEQAGQLGDVLRTRRVSLLATDQEETQSQRIFTFPLQFAHAQKKLTNLVAALFRSNPFQESAVLRGFYFTSATQQGDPVDHLTAPVPVQAAAPVKSGAPGLPPMPGMPPMPSMPPTPVVPEAAPWAPDMQSAPVERRSYFLNRLFCDVIFPDQNLVRRTRRAQRRRYRIRMATVLGSLLGFGLLGFYLVACAIWNRNLISETIAHAHAVQRTERSSSNLDESLDTLELLRQDERTLDHYARKFPLFAMREELYRADKLYAPIRKIYFDRIKTLFIEPCAKQLHADLEALAISAKKTLSDSEKLYEMNRMYEMLGGLVKPNKAMLAQYFQSHERWLVGLKTRSPTLTDHQRKIARLQLAFWLLELDRVHDWKVSIDQRLVKRVNDELGRDLWIELNYQQMIETGKQTHGLISKKEVIKTRYADLVTVERDFSKVYSQAGYDNYVRAAITEQSKRLSTQYKTLGLTRSAASIGKEMTERYVREYIKRWDQFAGSIQVASFKTLKDLDEGIRDLTGPNSPYEDVFQAVWAGRVLQLDKNDIRNKPKITLKWLNQILDTVSELQAAIGKLEESGGVPDSLPDLKKLEQVVQAFGKARNAITQELKVVVDPDQRQQIQRDFARILETMRSALTADNERKVNAMWAGTVLKLYTREMLGRYPFRASAADDVAGSDFDKMFNPRTGLLWAKLKIVRQHQNLLIGGKSLLPVGTSFEAQIKFAEHIRDTLYAQKGLGPRVVFWVTLKQRSGVKDINLRVGDRTLGLWDRPDRRAQMLWSGSDTVGARLEISVGDNQWLGTDRLKSPWGLFRLLASGQAKIESRQQISYSWRYDARVAGRLETFTVEIVLNTANEKNPFTTQAFFSRFQCPRKLND